MPPTHPRRSCTAVLLVLASCLLGAIPLSGQSRPAGAVSKVAPLVADALAQARNWQADSKLVAVFAKTGGDGRIDPKALAGPANMDGGFLAFHAHSPSAGMMRSYGLDASGGVVAQGPPMPAGTQTTPLPDRFLDLDVALVKAKAVGLKPPPADGKSFLDARLTGVAGVAGKANGALWTFVAVDQSGQFPVPADPVSIDAATGAQTTEEAASGRLERRVLAEELSRGKTFPDGQRDWAFLRKESDAWAARWNKDLKPWSFEAEGQLVRGRFAPGRARFRYFVPNPDEPGGSLVSEVAVFPSGGSMLLRLDSIDQPKSPSELRLVAMPDRVLSPEDAAARLRALAPGLADPIPLALVSGDNLVESAARAGRPSPPQDAALVKGRWLWLSRSVRLVREQESVFVWDRPVSESVAIDAVTGEAVVKPPAAASRPSGEK